MTYRRLLWALLLTCAGARAQDTASLHGHATTPPNGRPLARVHVRLSSATPEGVSYGATSGDDGNFSIEGIAAGTYKLLVDHPVYYCLPPEEIKPSGRLTFKPGEQVADLRLQMVPPAILSGRVVDENGRPVDFEWGLSIDVANPDEVSAVTLTGGEFGGGQKGKETGEYRAGVPPGKYYIYLEGGSSGDDIQPDGRAVPRFFATTYYSSATSKKAATVVEAKPGEEIGGLDIRVAARRPLSISGIASGGHSGSPVHVTVHKENNATLVMNGEVVTDPPIVAGPDGGFQAKDLEPGIYHVSASSNGTSGKLRSTIQKIELTDSPATGVSLVLLPPAKVSGTMQLPGAAGHMVILRPADDNFLSAQYPPHSASVARNGSFELDGVEPELFSLTLSPAPENVYIKSIVAGGTAAVERQAVREGESEGEFAPVVDLRQSGGGLKLTMTFGPGASVSGKAAGGAVILAPEGKTSVDDVLVARPSADGTFKFERLPPGTYRLLAADSEFFDNSDSPDLEKLLSGAKRIELKEGEHKTEDLNAAK